MSSREDDARFLEALAGDLDSERHDPPRDQVVVTRGDILRQIAGKIRNSGYEGDVIDPSYEVVQTVKIDPESLGDLVNAIRGVSDAIDRMPG